MVMGEIMGVNEVYVVVDLCEEVMYGMWSSGGSNGIFVEWVYGRRGEIESLDIEVGGGKKGGEVIEKGWDCKGLRDGEGGVLVEWKRGVL